MKMLAIETSSTACSLALENAGEITFIHQIMPMQQAFHILPLIEDLLNLSHLKLNQLDAIAFGCGPGSFTGVRIAASVTQGLGFALNLPIIPISSLAALAQAAYDEHGWHKIMIGVDARMQELYSGAYEVNMTNTVSLQGEERLLSPENLINPIGGEWYGAGNAFDVYADSLSLSLVEVDTHCLPTAVAIVKLAKIKYNSQDWVLPKEALPVYLRNNVAKKPR